MRSDGYVHGLPVVRESNIPGPVTAALQPASGGQIRHDDLRGAAGFQVSALVRKAHDGISIGDIDELRIGPQWIKCDSEGLLQPGRKDFRLFGGAIFVNASEEFNLARSAFSNEQISIWRGADEPGIVKAGGVLLNLESGRRLRPGISRPGHQLGNIEGRFGCERPRQISRGDPMDGAGPLRAIVRVNRAGVFAVAIAARRRSGYAVTEQN